ncbi:MAG: O-antigen ligase family protein [Clostridiales bacterium]|jgi:O-antigen ligase|nr:O-antigen ligase family protein [Clostridiales bacterium]
MAVVSKEGPKITKAQAEPVRFSQLRGAEKVMALTLTALAAVVPIFVRYVQLPYGPDMQSYITRAEYHADIFSYYKSIILLVGAGLLLYCMLDTAVVHIASMPQPTLVGNFKALLKSAAWKRITGQPFFIAMVILLLGIVGSSLYSSYRYTVTHGIYDRYESVFVMLAYFVIFFSAGLVVKRPFVFRMMLWGLLFSCLIISIVGALQLFGVDLFLTRFGSAIIMGDPDRSLRSNFANQNLAYATLYNPNSAGSYCALMLPLTITCAVCYFKRIPLFILSCVCSVLTFLMTLGTSSEGAIAGLGFAAIVAMMVLIRRIDFKRYARTLFVAGAAVIVVIAAVMIVPNVRDRVTEMAGKALSLGNVPIDNFFQDMSFQRDTVTFYTKNGSMTLQYDQPSRAVTVRDKDGVTLTPVSQSSDENMVTYEYNNDIMGRFYVDIPENTFTLRRGGAVFWLSSVDGEVCPLTILGDPIANPGQIAAWGFEDSLFWGSGRGFIWSRTFPMLLKRLLLGSGPDSFAIEFPQNDMVGCVKTFGTPYMTIDKAHNIFLQTGVNYGVPAMLALMFMMIYFIVAGINLLKKKEEVTEIWMQGFACLLSVCGYLVSVMFTDSVVSVTPIFYMIFGMGAFILLRRQSGEQAPRG